MQPTSNSIKWPEILSLAFLNVSIVISWIAYHEYQPALIEKFEFQGLFTFLIVTKAIVLVIVPPIAGILADYLLKKNGKYFTLFTVGIGSTAMIFMAVATVLGAAPLATAKSVLPFMIVLWLIAMNLFISPANSMIDSFGPAHKLPIVVGFLFLSTELIYALEPIIVELVRFFGDTLTFVVGGILISVSGIVFYRVSSNEVIDRKKEMMEQPQTKTEISAFLAVITFGLFLGLGKAFLIEYFPHFMDQKFNSINEKGGYIALGLLALSALFAFSMSSFLAKKKMSNVILTGFITLTIGILIIGFGSNLTLYILGGVVTALSFGALNVVGLPFVFKNLSVRYITYGVGIFIGASEFFTGLFEYYLV